jgi:hypothetical protein
MGGDMEFVMKVKRRRWLMWLPIVAVMTFLFLLAPQYQLVHVNDLQAQSCLPPLPILGGSFWGPFRSDYTCPPGYIVVGFDCRIFSGGNCGAFAHRLQCQQFWP